VDATKNCKSIQSQREIECPARHKDLQLLIERRRTHIEDRSEFCPDLYILPAREASGWRGWRRREKI
jgi:hypothetical protein